MVRIPFISIGLAVVLGSAALAADPAALALVAQGKKLKRRGKTDEAIRVLREAVWKDRKCVEAHYALGWLFLGKRHEFGTKWHFDHVIELAPKSQMAREARRALVKLASLPPAAPGPRPATPAPPANNAPDPRPRRVTRPAPDRAAPAASAPAWPPPSPPIRLPAPPSYVPSSSPHANAAPQYELSPGEGQAILRTGVKILFVILMVVVTGLVNLVRRKFGRDRG